MTITSPFVASGQFLLLPLPVATLVAHVYSLDRQTWLRSSVEVAGQGCIYYVRVVFGVATLDAPSVLLCWDGVRFTTLSDGLEGRMRAERERLQARCAARGRGEAPQGRGAGEDEAPVARANEGASSAARSRSSKQWHLCYCCLPQQYPSALSEGFTTSCKIVPVHPTALYPTSHTFSSPSLKLRFWHAEEKADIRTQRFNQRGGIAALRRAPSQ